MIIVESRPTLRTFFRMASAPNAVTEHEAITWFGVLCIVTVIFILVMALSLMGFYCYQHHVNKNAKKLPSYKEEAHLEAALLPKD